MKHKGQILEKAVRNSKIPIKRIADAIRYTNRHMYNFFEKEDLPLDIFIAVGKVIGHDFSGQLPELIEYIKQNQSKTDSSQQNDSTSNEEYKAKYFELLEIFVKEAHDFKSRIKALEDEVFKNQNRK